VPASGAFFVRSAQEDPAMIGIPSEKCWDYDAVIGKINAAVKQQFAADHPGETWEMFLFALRNEPDYPCEISVVIGGETAMTLELNPEVEALIHSLTNILRESKQTWNSLKIDIHSEVDLVRLR
jgi:hypothetical protein